MFTDQLTRIICDAADRAGFERAALLAFVEIETAGNTFEADGRTPRFLYERHVAWREAKKVSQKILGLFQKAGLAIPKWSRATQYKDQGTSAGRMALIGRARALHEETANRSASWGIGQVMGFNASLVGYPTATVMVDDFTANVPAQLNAMIRFLRKSGVDVALKRLDWQTVARVYNGDGYKQNRYDTRLADAYRRHKRRLDTMAAGAPRAVIPNLSPAEIKDAQEKLRAAGYTAVGVPDGEWKRGTLGAVAQFQAHEGLPQTGTLDAETREALASAVPVEAGEARKRATADDLEAAGSRTIKTANKIGLLAKLQLMFGGLFVGGGTADHVGLLDTAQSGVEKALQAKGIWDSVSGLLGPALAHPVVIVVGLVLIGGGFAAYHLAGKIKAWRVEDHRSGAHAGHWSDANV